MSWSVAAALAQGKDSVAVSPADRTHGWLRRLPVFPAIIFKAFGSFTAASFYVALLQCLFSALVCWPFFT